ncbi:hypothetical protein AB0E61_06360 [Streptomyces catenulae]|uniref:SalK n=1 Tax=Streptomyces catenulae TaxID=66875 RepID=A0ABV2YVD0_9ACTN|nr:hypothetical protein [Streptomyces catenulae]
MSDYLSVARRMWQQLEPLHATAYSTPEAQRVAAGLGYDTTSWRPGYFAWRTAPLGAVGPELVTATYYTFAPRLVAQSVPRVWAVARPGAVLDARLRSVDRALRRLLGDRLAGPEVAEAARLARRAAENAQAVARPLAAANRDLPWPGPPHLVLWQAAAVLREHRGDGHLATLLTWGLDPCEALVSHAAAGGGPGRHGWAAPASAAARGWSAQEWSDAHDRLAARGWLAPDGSATAAGLREREAIERMTDQLAAGPWRALGRTGAERLHLLLRPLNHALRSAGLRPPEAGTGSAPPVPPGSRREVTPGRGAVGALGGADPVQVAMAAPRAAAPRFSGLPPSPSSPLPPPSSGSSASSAPPPPERSADASAPVVAALAAPGRMP